jgi:hypothetical protein
VRSLTESPVAEDLPLARRMATPAADVIAVGLLAAALIGMAFQDGGQHPVRVFPVAILGLLAVPVASRQLHRLRRPVALLLVVWSVGLTLSFTFAAERTDFVHPMLVLSLMPILALATLYVWERPFGPVALLVILGLGFGASWGHGFLDWLGVIETPVDSLGPPPRWREEAWMAVSWHNQSGMLMAAYGLLFTGIALFGRPKVAVAAGAVTAAGLAATWLSASRGALLAAIVGVGVVAIMSARSAGLRTTVLRVALLTLVTATLAVALLATQPSPEPRSIAGPIAEREDVTSPTHVALRFHHWAGAWNMFIDRPVTGQGPGSYLEIAPEHTSPQGNLTAHAHNVYLEALAEGGVVFGLPVLGVAVGGAILVLTALTAWDVPTEHRRPPGAGDGDPREHLRRQLAAGAAAALAALGIRAGFDFDWAYLVLAALFAVCAMVVREEVAPPRSNGLEGARPILTVIAGFLLAMPLAAGSIGAYVESHASPPEEGAAVEVIVESSVPWDSRAARSNARALIDRGELPAARATLERSLAWNPGNHALGVHRAAVDRLEGRIDSDELLRTLREPSFRGDTHNLVIATLLDVGEHQRASDLIHETLELYEVYRVRGVTYGEVVTWQLLIRHDAETEGCYEAVATAKSAVEAIPPDPFEEVDVEARIAEILDEVCPA